MKTAVRRESWPIRGGFRIAHGARDAAEVVVLELRSGPLVGRGECVPYARYGESTESVIADIEAILAEPSPTDLRARLLPVRPGAARNAIDCALWDLEAARNGEPVWRLAGRPSAPGPIRTMRTVSVDDPRQMGDAAEALEGARVIKVKVDGDGDLERIAAVHERAPDAELIVDPNESWSADQLRRWLPSLPALGVTVLEQPLPADDDAALVELRRPLSICADESFHDRSSFSAIEGRYDMVNIKLDKAGGLTEALECLAVARRAGVGVMIGCMVATSLAIEPALLLASDADFVDLDGPLLLERDREGALHDREAGLLHSSPSVWGGG